MTGGWCTGTKVGHSRKPCIYITASRTTFKQIFSLRNRI